MDTLHSIARDGNLEKVRSLIRDGADINAEEDGGLTPLHYSAVNGRTDIAKLLISAGADVNAKVEEGHACSNANSHEAIVQRFIFEGADIFAEVGEKGYTPLHYGARSGHTDIVKILISAGAEVNTKAKTGRSPLHRSVLSGFADIVKELIFASADVNARDENGYTPLLYSCWNGHRDINIVKALISAGADSSAVDKWGRNFFECDRRDNEKIEKAVIKYTVLYNNKPNLKEKFEHSNEKLYRIWHECEKQVERMKETWLGVSCTSFYEFITETFENKLALYASEENFGLKDDLERSSHIEMFPMYAEDLEDQFKKGSLRAILLHKSQELMFLCFGHTLPPELVRRICEYMTNGDIQNFLRVNNIL